MIFLLVLSILCCIPIACQRLSLEAASRSVELAIDYNSVLNLCRSEGWQEDRVMASLSKAGATAISFSEDTLKTLKLAGRANWYVGYDVLQAIRRHGPDPQSKPRNITLKPLPEEIYLEVYDRDTLDQLIRFLPIFLGRNHVQFWPSAPSGNFSVSLETPVFLQVTADEREFPFTGLGFPRKIIEKYSRLGFRIILRPENKNNLDPQAVVTYIRELRTYPQVFALIFGGLKNEVLGYPDNLDIVVENLREWGTGVGLVEAPTVRALQKGSQTLGLKLAEQCLRVQSIAPLHQLNLTPPDVTDMFCLGARERNIRILYIRLFGTVFEGRDLLQTNLEYLSRLRSKLGHHGFRIGNASPFPGYEPPFFLLLLIASGVASAVLLLLLRFHPLPAWIVLVALCGSVLLVLAGKLSGHLPLARKILALAAAITMPTLSLILHLPYLRAVSTEEKVPAMLARISILLMRICAISILGGIMLVGLLSSTPFFLQADQFRGIKLLMLSPLVAALFYLTREAPEPAPLKEIFSLRLVLWHALAIIAIAAGAVFYILRTGNVPEGSASDVERQMRNILDTIFLARPRFKEFLVGHPSLFLAAASLRQGFTSATWLLVLLLGIGQANIVDTFAHVHTPLAVSLLRTVNGILLGWILGLLEFTAFLAVFKQEKTTKR